MPSPITHTPWLPSPPRALDRPKLFCFSYAGAGASAFRSWATHALGGYDLCPVQLPGREGRADEPARTSSAVVVQEMADGLAQYLDGPFAFFGHSIGALIAFELARELRRRGLPGPRHLFVSGRVAPQIPASPVRRDTLSDEDFIGMLRRLKGTPPEVLADRELMAFLMPLLRADFALNDDYRYAPEPPLDCAITAYGGTDDVLVAVTGIAAWRSQTVANFEMHMFEGEHFFVHSERERLLAHLATRLTTKKPSLPRLPKPGASQASSQTNVLR